LCGDGVTPNEHTSPGIGTLNERALHAQLKAWLAEPDDRFEVPVGRHVVDIVRGSLLIEVQTGSTFPLKRKLQALLKHHCVCLVVPITGRKTITQLDSDGRTLGSRRSPKRGEMIDIFHSLVSLRDVLGDGNLSIEGLLVHVEEIRRPCSGRRWKSWEVVERRLIDVIDRASFHHPGEFLAVIPSTLGEPFTTAELARATERPRRVAQKIAYCLREMGALAVVDRRRDGIRYVKRF
jgi:hypothetical protein